MVGEQSNKQAAKQKMKNKMFYLGKKWSNPPAPQMPRAGSGRAGRHQAETPRSCVPHPRRRAPRTRLSSNGPVPGAGRTNAFIPKAKHRCLLPLRLSHCQCFSHLLGLAGDVFLPKAPLRGCRPATRTCQHHGPARPLAGAQSTTHEQGAEARTCRRGPG